MSSSPIPDPAYDPIPEGVVPKPRASLESALRTLVQVILGAVVGYISSRPADPNDRAWVMGLVTTVASAVIAAVMRFFVPIQTDYSGKHVAGKP